MQNRIFYTDNQGHYYVCLCQGVLNKTSEPCFTIKDLYYDVDEIVMTEEEMKEHGIVKCEGYEVYGPAGNNHEKVQEVKSRIGIGYVCPFCGGTLCWENDFMMSEFSLISAENVGYYKIEDEDRVKELVEQEGQLKKSNVLSDTDDIEKDNEKINSDGEYSTMYKKETKDGVVSWYEINDAVIGRYTCQNCGKKYEVCDCLPSEQNEYPYFQK